MFHGHTSVFSRTAYRRLLMCITGILIALGIAVFCQTALTEDAQADSPEEATLMGADGSLLETDEIFIEIDGTLAGADEIVPANGGLKGLPGDVDELESTFGNGNDPEDLLCDEDDPQGMLCDEDPAEPEDANDTDNDEPIADEEPVCAEAAVPDEDTDTENAAYTDRAVAVLSDDLLDPEPLTNDIYEDDGSIESIETEEDDKPDPADDPSAIENIKLRSGGVSADPMDVLLGVVAQHQRQGNNIQVISSDPMTGRVVYATD